MCNNLYILLLMNKYMFCILVYVYKYMINIMLYSLHKQLCYSFSKCENKSSRVILGRSGGILILFLFTYLSYCQKNWVWANFKHLYLYSTNVWERCLFQPWQGNITAFIYTTYFFNWPRPLGSIDFKRHYCVCHLYLLTDPLFL